MHCGVAFATDDMRYQTDGRTVSSEDPDAYLTSPPPKVRSHKGKAVIAMVAIIAVAVLIGLALSASAPDARFNYTLVSETYEGDYYVCVYDLNIVNVKVNDLKCGNLIPVLYTGSTPHPVQPPAEHLYDDFPVGATWKWEGQFSLTMAEILEGVRFEWTNLIDTRTFDVQRDPSMNVEPYRGP
jgi:hypothetical protein